MWLLWTLLHSCKFIATFNTYYNNNIWLVILMGSVCCYSKEEVLPEFERNWTIFNNSDLSNRENFHKNKYRIFEYFYYSIKFVILQKIKSTVTAYQEKYVKKKGNKDKDTSNIFTKIIDDLNDELKSGKKQRDRSNIYVKSPKSSEKKIKPQIKYESNEPKSEQYIYSQPNENRQTTYHQQKINPPSIRNSMKQKQQQSEAKSQSKQKSEDNAQKQESVNENNHQIVADSAFHYSLPGSVLSQIKDGEQSKIVDFSKVQNNVLEKLREQQQKIASLERELKKHQEQKEKLVAECIEKTDKIKSLAELELKVKAMEKRHFQQNQTLGRKFEDQIAKMRKQNEELKIHKELLDKKNKELQNQLNNHQIAIKSKKEDEEVAQIYSKKAEQTNIKSDPKQQSFSLILSLFSASAILPNYRSFDEAVEVRKQIVSMFGSKVRCSEAVYAYDALTPTHCHQYIEGRQNLLFLIKLPNDVVLGAFAGKATENTHAESFVFSLSAQRAPMKLSASKAVHRIDADRSFIVFGNGEIRIKAKSLELYSNLGSFQGLYTLGGKAVDYKVFMETKEREITMRTYEVHQIQFQE